VKETANGRAKDASLLPAAKAAQAPDSAAAEANLPDADFAAPDHQAGALS
jgi:hypothetical protein